MTDRQRRILASLVAEYIEQGEPVSSSWLAEHSTLGLSPATVRNILARLEEQGLVHQPHTSAGRIPTDSGYRQYVDSLLLAHKRPRSLPEVEARLRRSPTVDDLLAHASQELSRVSHHIGFAIAPTKGSQRLRRLDFVALDGTRVLVIVVSTTGQITHRIIDTRQAYSGATLTQAANYLNSEFGGLTLTEAREAVLQRMHEERALYDALAQQALALAESGLADVGPTETVHVQGTLLLIDEFAGGVDSERAMAALRVLVRMIEEKHQLIELLTHAIDANGLTVVIGSEHAAPEMYPFSMVVSTRREGGHTATVGVIGPTRMRYQRAISVVDGVSQLVSRVLEGQ